MKLFRFIGLFLILLFGAGVGFQAFFVAAQTTQAFSDVYKSHVNATAITELKARGALSGYPDGTFKPDQLVNRAEALKIILLSSKIDAPEIYTSSDFIDIAPGAWFAKYVAKAKAWGIIEGYPDKTFRAYQNVNLVEALKVLITSNNLDLGRIIVLEDPYRDAYKNQWYSKYVAYAKEKNLIDVDFRNMVHPAQALTRGKLAEIMYRFVLALEAVMSSKSSTGATTTDNTITTTPSSGSTITTPTSSTTSSPTSTLATIDSSAKTGSGTTGIPPDALVKAGLPSHFAFGIASSDNDQLNWMKTSGAAWDYRYQYLTSGVNTGRGWATAWASKTALPGQFATTYLKSSLDAGYIPVFTYYQLEPSQPHPVDAEPDVNLNNSSTMKAYFEDWKLLMQKCGEFDKLVIVHHEPDLWGYMQQQHGSNPANVSVSVASSGFAEAADYPNNAIGFAQALVKLRDKYAPKVVLGWHVSHWATNMDVVLNKADPIKLGKQTADFYLALKANFDLLFFDPADRNAGYYQYLKGNPRRWWDDAAFARFREFISVITKETGKKAMLWQVPLGNTLYRTVNNTKSHYQDNKVQYFLKEGNAVRIAEYGAAGVIGVLFGAGIDDDTTNYDKAKDGITNPAPVNGNDLEAKYADDDGGFLRTAATAYYFKGPLKLEYMSGSGSSTSSTVTTGTEASKSTPITGTIDSFGCLASKMLNAFVTCIVGHFGSFVVPTETQQADFRAVVKQMLNRQCDNITIPSSLSGIYSAKTFNDTETSKNYCVFFESGDKDGDSKVDNGWGAFIVNNQATRELNIAIPHPIDDTNTEHQGISVFKGTDSRTYLLAGATRHLGGPSACTGDRGYDTSDAAHNIANMFWPATQEIDAWYGPKMWTQLQLHGMAVTTCPGVDIFMTYGVTAIPKTDDIIVKLKTNLLKYFPKLSVTVMGDTPACGLTATGNSQGRYLNNPDGRDYCTTFTKTYNQKFIHIEQSPVVRKDVEYGAMIDAIKATWP